MRATSGLPQPRNSASIAAMKQILSAWLIVLIFCAAPARAETAEIWSAEKAHRAALAREIILLDIRTPEEWAETGIGQGAWPISMHTKDFGSNIRAIISGNRGTPIALICATGGRSDYLAGILRSNGIGPVIDVGEGMMGSAHGGGWLKSGLPVTNAAAAANAMPGDLILPDPE